MVLEVKGCHSSVVRAPVAKAGGPGFESPATTKIFHTFPLLFSTPYDSGQNDCPQNYHLRNTKVAQLSDTYNPANI